MGPADLDRLCPDWRERETFVSGPARCSTRFAEHCEQARATASACTWSASSPSSGSATARRARAARSSFLVSDAEAESDGSKPILVAGEEAGLDLPYGCREGICHTCVGELRSGRVRDLRNGKVYGEEGEMIRTCINAPEGPVEIELWTTDRGDTHDTTATQNGTGPAAPTRALTPRTRCTGSRRSRSRRSDASSTSCTSRSRPTSATATPATSAR